MSPSQSSQSGLFRIERKQLLEQRRDEKKKLQVMEERSTNNLVIGTHSSCGLTLDDPITAERHCEIVQRDGRYWINDLTNASGTFLNGIQVREMTALAVGDRIALGAAILEVHQDEEEPSALCIHVYEGAFFHTLKKQGEFLSDADEWVRSEVTFGRTPKLKMLNWATCLVALLVAIWLLSGPRGEMALQPGHLLDSHAHLFVDSGDGPMALPAGYPSLAFMRDLAQREGCDACHDSFGQPSSEKCAACHQEVVRAAVAQEAHPFEGGASLVCVDCHREHFGGQPVPNTVTPAYFEERCGDCHGDSYADPISLLAGLELAESEYKLTGSSNQVLPRRITGGFEAFSHGDHSEIQDCSTCHITAETDQGWDFAALSFETCDQCHGADLDPASGLALGVELPPDDKRWTVNWHGVGEDQNHCRQCHSTSYAAELNKLERSDPIALTFDLGLRTHGDQFHLAPKPEDCSRCHVGGDDLPLGRMITGRPFSHDIHLSFLVRDDPTSVSAVNQQCAECHIEIINSSALAAAPVVFSGPPVSVCAKCHHESDGLALITNLGVPMSQVAKHSAHDFPHDRHTGIEGGCVACHDMDTSSPAGAIMISTPAEKAACVRCHMDQQQGANLSHMNIGGGDCVVCHQPTADSEPGSLLSVVFYGAQPKERRISHFPHHQEGHQGTTCRECHGDPAVQGEVHSPRADAASCRACHAGSRFHWR